MYLFVYRGQLESVFDLVIVKDVALLSKRLSPGKYGYAEENALVISTMSMSMFEKIVLVRPGVTVSNF